MSQEGAGSPRHFSRWTVLGIGWYVLVGGLLEMLSMHGLAAATYRHAMSYADRQRSRRFADFFRGCVARTYDVRGHKDKALSLLEEAVRMNPKDAMVYFDLAEFYFLHDQKQLAIQNYEKALELETDEQWRRMIQTEINRLQESEGVK